jgi:hypothetical protein
MRCLQFGNRGSRSWSGWFDAGLYASRQCRDCSVPCGTSRAFVITVMQLQCASHAIVEHGAARGGLHSTLPAVSAGVCSCSEYSI